MKDACSVSQQCIAMIMLYPSYLMFWIKEYVRCANIQRNGLGWQQDAQLVLVYTLLNLPHLQMANVSSLQVLLDKTIVSLLVNQLASYNVHIINIIANRDMPIIRAKRARPHCKCVDATEQSLRQNCIDICLMLTC